MRRIPWLVVTLVLLAGCCTPEECKPENLPHGGVIEISEDDTHQEKLFDLLRYAAINDCCDALYEHLSKKTRDEYRKTTICVFWDSLEVPEYEYPLDDVVRLGEFSGTVPGPKDGEEFVYVSYTPEGGKDTDNLLVQILLLHQTDENGKRVLRVGLLDQYEHIEAGHYDYDWNASR